MTGYALLFSKISMSVLVSIAVTLRMAADMIITVRPFEAVANEFGDSEAANEVILRTK
jgi:hypothetical protein